MNVLNGLKSKLNLSVLVISGGALTLFVIFSILFPENISKMVDKGFSLSITYFGAYWQLLLLATFIVGLVLALSKYGKVRLGNIDQPQLSFFQWASIITASGLGAGAIFWAAAEPLYYYLETPPMYKGIESATADAIQPALAQSFMDWGFTSWAAYGSISAIIIMYAHHNKGLSLRPRTLVYPIFGEKIEHSKWGIAVDVFCILGAAAGAIGTIGFFGFQFSYWLHDLLGTPDSFVMQLSAVAVLIVIVVISAVTGLEKGIQFFSKFNVWLAVLLGAFILIAGPGGFILDQFISSYGTFADNFINMSTFRGDNEWLGAWMLFFFGWFIGFGPLMAILVARVSRGRTIREIFFVVSIVAAVSSHVWFTIVGGSGLFFEIINTGSVSEPLMEYGLPAAIIATASQLPLGTLVVTAFLLITITFVVTTADSMSYSLAMAVTGEGDPPKIMRAFFAVLMGAIAIVLINIGEGSVDALQSFIIITAVPISIIMLPSLWGAPKIAKILAIEQGIIAKKK